MSQHHLEEYFKQNREAFDAAIPSLKVWADIDNQLDEKFKRSHSYKVYFRIAAAILVLVVAGGIMKPFAQQKTNAVAILPPNVAEAVSFYKQKFQKKYVQLASLPHDATIDVDLEEIYDIINEIEKELENAPKGSEERILESLIEAHKVRIQMLDRILDRIQQDKPLDEKIVENESVSI